MLLHLRRSFLMKPVLARTYLSSGYNCADSWNKRLSTPILEKIKLEEFYVDIEQKFQQQRKTSAIDVDIFVNRVTDGNHVDEIADLVHKLRLTEEASSILDSTSHALIRSYVENDHIPFLLQILRDPLNYGIFLDTFTANLALDKLIELKDFNSAAQIASFLMLQEDFGNDITKAMCLYACVKYLENPDPFVKEEVVASTEEAEKKPVPKAKKGKKEENRVRVKFLRNEFFDDHFDLKLPRHLIGKTLQLLSKECPKSVQKSVEILGLCLFDKYDQCLKVIQQLDKNVEIHQDILELCKNILAETPSENESYKLLLDAFNSFGVALVKRSFEEDSLSLLKTSIEKNASQDIEAQKQIYDSWLKVRETSLNEELTRLKRALKLKEIEQATKAMEVDEKKLWFFENEEQIDLEIESKTVRYPKRWFGKKKKPRVIDEGYVPPEIRQMRR